jgi:hypothetical protein
MRGYVERLEAIERELPEGQEATYEDYAESIREEADNARDADKNK